MLNRQRASYAAPWITAALVGMSSGSWAVAYGTSPVTVSLGSGVWAERYPVPCGYPLVGTTCFAWRLEGLVAPLPFSLSYANMFAAARGGRIVAAIRQGVVFTDDRGAHWRPSRWEAAQGPLSLAFDPGSDFGAAVGANGSLWTTDDRGETWRLRRDRSGQVLVDVAVVGRTVAFSDTHGGVWVSTDGGTSVRTLAERTEGAMPTMLVHRGAIWLLLQGSVWWRADAHGNVERVEHGPMSRR